MRFARQLRVPILQLVACAFLAQCGGVSEKSPRGPYRAPEAPPEAAEVALASAQCDYLERCDPDGLQVFAGGANEACVDYFACEAARGNVPWRKSATPSQGLEACVQSLTSRPCPAEAERAPGTPFSYLGMFDWGAECGAPDVASLFGPAPDAPNVGEACIHGLSERATCQEGAYCAVADELPSFGSIYCGTCATPLELGQACMNRDRCQGAARCISGLCREPLPAGTPCTQLAECRSFTCEDGACGPTSGQEPYAEVLERGCERWSDCGSQAGLRCHDGRCRPLPSEGEVCDPNALRSCRAGQACIAERCVALGCSLDVGEACETYCDGGDCVDQVCKPAGSRVGAPCSSSCAAGLVCLSSECTAPADDSDGAACDFNYECESRYCARDLSAYCSRSEGCSPPSCDGCGTCSAPPVAADCR